MYTNIQQRGFTLIETIVYIALLGFLMTSTLTCVWSLLESARKSDGRAVVQGEGSFVERKLAWALADMSAAPAVDGSGCNQTLTVYKTNYPKNPVVFQRSGTNNAIEIREGGAAPVALTTANVSAACLTFVLIPASGKSPAGVTATATIDDLAFTITRYVRK
jgi:prepilin-type N-terminal cleavage/methylation domain-containing protein